MKLQLALGTVAATVILLSLPSMSATKGEMLFWESIMKSEEIGDYQAYLKQYPKGDFVALARARIAALTPKAEPPAPAPPAQQAKLVPGGSAPSVLRQGPRGGAQGVLEAQACPGGAGDLGALPALKAMMPEGNQLFAEILYRGLGSPEPMVRGVMEKLQTSRAKFYSRSPARFYGSEAPISQEHANCLALREKKLPAWCRMKAGFLDYARANPRPNVGEKIGVLAIFNDLVSDLDFNSNWEPEHADWARHQLEETIKARPVALSMLGSLGGAASAVRSADRAENDAAAALMGRSTSGAAGTGSAATANFLRLAREYYTAKYDAHEQYYRCELNETP